MRVISNEVLAVENGTDSATVFDYGEDKVCMKFQMEDGTILVKFFSSKELGSYPWSNVFRALNADNTDALLDRSVEITVSNNVSKKTGKCFCNIKRFNFCSHKEGIWNTKRLQPYR